MPQPSVNFEIVLYFHSTYVTVTIPYATES